MLEITKQQFTTLNDLFAYYNETLFNNELPSCLVSLARHKGAHGYFSPDRWKDATTETAVHEIALNPDTMNRPDVAWHSTLVHEMVHLFEENNGTAPRRCYHNKSWANKMESVGLMPSTTGRPGGKRTGQSVTHYVIEGGPFEVAFNGISAEDKKALKLPYVPNSPKALPEDLSSLLAGALSSDDGSEGDNEKPKSANGVKVKYSCGGGCNVWGKPNLHIHCDEHETKFEAVS